MQAKETDATSLVRFISHDENLLLFILPSSTGKHAPYQVKLHFKNIPHPEMNVWSCECGDFKYRQEQHLRYECKHIRAVKAFLSKMANI